jgi:hypothetical protein
MRTATLPVLTIASILTSLLNTRLWAKPQPAPTNTLANISPLLRDGDVIFIRIANALYRRVAETSQSWESHVGILFSRADGSWEVAESTVPIAKKTPLDRFIARSEHGRFTILRSRTELQPAQQERLRQAAESRMGKFYHLGFNYDSPRLYCSKLVFDSYREATGIELGQLQTFRQLMAANPAAPIRFWRIWFFGVIPWERRCITTTSLLTSPQLQLVCETKSN